jgi:hypothetical protein
MFFIKILNVIRKSYPKIFMDFLFILKLADGACCIKINLKIFKEYNFLSQPDLTQNPKNFFKIYDQSLFKLPAKTLCKLF